MAVMLLLVMCYDNKTGLSHPLFSHLSVGWTWVASPQKKIKIKIKIKVKMILAETQKNKFEKDKP